MELRGCFLLLRPCFSKLTQGNAGHELFSQYAFDQLFTEVVFKEVWKNIPQCLQLLVKS
jgi:hypothetical protein